MNLSTLLIALTLTVGTCLAGRAFAQEPTPAPPPVPDQGGNVVRQAPRDPDRLRGVRGRDVINLWTNVSVGTNGVGKAKAEGLRSTLVEASMLSDFQTRLTVTPFVTPVSWQVTGDVAYRGYDTSELLSLGRSVGTSLAWGNSRTRLDIFGSAAYRPVFSLMLTSPSISEALAQTAIDQAVSTALGTPVTPTAIVDVRSGALPISMLDFAIATTPAYVGTTGAAVSRQLTARIGVGAQTTLNAMDYRATANNDTRDYGASGYMSYGLFKGASLHLGYGRRRAIYYRATGRDSVVLDNYDVGVDLTRGFRTRSGLTVGGRTGSVLAQDGSSRRIYVTGRADVSQTLGRSASLHAGYERDVQLPLGFLRPVITDAYTVGARGRFIGRSSWLISASRFHGTLLSASVDEDGSQKYHVTAGTARLNVPLARRASLYVEYLTYKQDSNRIVDVLDFIARDDLRQTARVGLTLDLPLLRDQRPPRRERP